MYTTFVYTIFVKNITLSANEDLIEAARDRARSERSTLNEQFRLWLVEYTRQGQRADQSRALIEEMQRYVNTGGRKFTRDEMNER